MVIAWRIEWIKLEHDLARAERRDPRNIDDAVKLAWVFRWK